MAWWCCWLDFVSRRVSPGEMGSGIRELGGLQYFSREAAPRVAARSRPRCLWWPGHVLCWPL